MPKYESIGQMDRKVTFQKKVYGTDASNQRKVLEWTNIAKSPTVYANVNEKSGREAFQADQLVGLTVADITVRYRDDLTIENRLLLDDKIFDIQAIIPVGRKKWLKLSCESGGQYTE